MHQGQKKILPEKMRWRTIEEDTRHQPLASPDSVSLVLQSKALLCCIQTLSLPKESQCSDTKSARVSTYGNKVIQTLSWPVNTVVIIAMCFGMSYTRKRFILTSI